MKKLNLILLSVLFAVAATAPALAQTAKTKQAAPAKPAATTKIKQAPAKREGGISGIVSGNVKGKSFTLGSKGGNYTVDASSARVTYKGKFFSLNEIKGGTMVTVTGKVTGKSIKADAVKVNYVKAAGNKTTTAKPVAKTTTTKKSKD